MGGTFDIVHFNKYCFNDGSGDTPNHFALVALSKKITKNITSFHNQIYCFVITTAYSSQGVYHKLNIANYACFKDNNTKIILDRIDLQSISDMSNDGNPLTRLNKDDRKSVYGKYINIHREVLNGGIIAINKILSATIIRELKKNK